MEDFEPSLIEGYLLCLCNAEAIRSQTSQWKRKLLFFMSGVAVEIAAVPVLSSLLGYDFSWAAWLLTAVFLPLGALGFYVSKRGSDRFVEFLLIAQRFGRKS
jgi:hypothetical protein